MIFVVVCGDVGVVFLQGLPSAFLFDGAFEHVCVVQKHGEEYNWIVARARDPAIQTVV